MSESADIIVRQNIAASRYEAVVQGLLCIADYVLESDRMIFTHTFVPPELRGKGVAAKLVCAALDDAREKRMKVEPACSYVARFIDRHPQYCDLIAP